MKIYKTLTIEHVVRIPPTKFGEDIKDSAFEILSEQFNGQIYEGIGFIIVVTNVQEIKHGKILHGDAATYHPVIFEVLAYEPILHEVVEGNVVEVVEAMPQEEIVFIPDKLMGLNLQNMTSKKIITYDGTCVVHEGFNPETVQSIRDRFPGVKILAHPECAPGVVALVDYAGGTAGMLNYIEQSSAKVFMLVTECGLTDRFKAEFKDKEIVGTCILCPYMKEIQLEDVLNALKNSTPEQIITIPADVAERARRSLSKMFELEKIGKDKLDKLVNT